MKLVHKRESSCATLQRHENRRKLKEDPKVRNITPSLEDDTEQPAGRFTPLMERPTGRVEVQIETGMPSGEY